jgi:uncharacterized LabA/DUF88 family protein
MAEERLKLAVFVDFDNIQIGVKDTLGKDFDVSVVLEALKERGEVVSKTAYGDWSRAGDYGRQMTQYAVQMVQRNVTPRGDKNGADINLALDALEMAFTRDHISGFAIVGGDSDFIALVEKLKQYDKRVFVVGGRQFTSGILQRNCHEFIAYENLLESATAGDGPRATRTARSSGRGSTEIKPLSGALPNIHRALKILGEREVAPQLGLLKSTLLQLDPTFTERDFGAGSFLEFIQKLEKADLVHLNKTDRGYLVEIVESAVAKEPAAKEAVTKEPVAKEAVTKEEESAEPASEASPAPELPSDLPPPALPESAPEMGLNSEETLSLLKKVLSALTAKWPSRPIYLRQLRQAMRSSDGRFDERQSGFRGLLDILHQAQREGWLRLHRDRKGIWRIFPTLPEAGPSPVAVEAVPELPAVTELDTSPGIDTLPEIDILPSESEILPSETDVLWEGEESPEETTVIEITEAPEPAPPPVEPPAPIEAVPEKKTRKPRSRTPRKASSRRKPKESPE